MLQKQILVVLGHYDDSRALRGEIQWQQEPADVIRRLENAKRFIGGVVVGGEMRVDEVDVMPAAANFALDPLAAAAYV